MQNFSPILRCTFWQGKVQNSSPILARQMVTSLPSVSLSLPLSLSVSLSLSLSLSLSPSAPHAQYRKRFRASYNRQQRFNPETQASFWLMLTKLRVSYAFWKHRTHGAWWALTRRRPEFPGWNFVVYSNISWKKKKVVWSSHSHGGNVRIPHLIWDSFTKYTNL